MTLTRRSSAVLMTAGALAVVAVAPVGADAAKRPNCKRANTKVLAKNSRAVVLERRNGPNDKTLYGCLRAKNKLIALDRATFDPNVESSYRNVRLSGRYVAWSFEQIDNSCKADCPPGYDPSTVGVSVRGLHRKSTRISIADVDSIPQVVLNSRGGVAWSERKGNLADPYVAIEARDRAGRRKLAEGGKEIKVRSLEVSRSRVTWNTAGGLRVARLGAF